MCFEILGFDIILDSSLHPQILEVNYTPSFTTDTPLDLQIKRTLIHDTLLLMNLTPKAKAQTIAERQREMKERTLTGKAFYHNKEARNKVIEEIQKFRNVWEMQHLGNFERVYPVFVELPNNR
jgi:tubulin polyglutamylase TTLL6/13